MRSTITIYKGNTYLRITDYKQDAVTNLLTPFCRRFLAKFGMKPNPPYKPIRCITHVFAMYNKDKTELKISAGLLDKFIDYAQLFGYKSSRILVIDEKEIEPEKVEFKWKSGWGELREGQEDWCSYQLAPGPIKVNNASTGFGKALPLDTPVLAKDGWKNIGDLKVGEHVFNEFGQLQLVEGAYDQGVTNNKELIFEDGRRQIACDDHQWEVNIDGRKQVMTTKAIYGAMSRNSKFECSILLTNFGLGTPFEERDEVTCPAGLAKYLKARMSRGTLDLPSLVFDLPYFEKMSFLAELEFMSKGTKLIVGEGMALSLQKLIWSIGGVCSYVKSTDDNLANKYLLSYQIPKGGERLNLKITSIIPAESCETRCISVSGASKLYVIKDWVVTHNTFMATHTIVNTGVRTLITALPRYIPIWIKALAESMDLTPEDVIIADNSSLQDIADGITNNVINPKIIILPITKYDGHYRRMKEDSSSVKLDELFSRMKIGLRIIDEAHESIYQLYCSMLHGNFHKTLALSATLVSDDEFINTIYDYVYPKKFRLKEATYSKYIDVIEYRHSMNVNRYGINTLGFGGYSHVKFEKAILKSATTREYYWSIINDCYNEFYLNEMKPGMKCLLFFATTKMVDFILGKLKKTYPDLDAVRYTNTEGSKAETKMSYSEHQVVVTTPGSCGTGKDIVDLAVVITGYSVSSMQRNDQMLGRTRPLKNYYGENPKFVFLTCSQIPKQVEYGRKRKDLFSNKTLSFKTVRSNLHLE